MKQLRDPNARHSGKAPTRTLAQAEKEAVALLEKLQAAPHRSLELVRAHSECSSALMPGDQAGVIGWVNRGGQENQLEASLEAAVFTLNAGCFSDVLPSSRGVHILHRLA